ncbi:hypothetical protein MD484_g8873, partial [Candolleomyces efflorescens]
MIDSSSPYEPNAVLQELGPAINGVRTPLNKSCIIEFKAIKVSHGPLLSGSVLKSLAKAGQPLALLIQISSLTVGLQFSALAVQTSYEPRALTDFDVVVALLSSTPRPLRTHRDSRELALRFPRKSPFHRSLYLSLSSAFVVSRLLNALVVVCAPVHSASLLRPSAFARIVSEGPSATLPTLAASLPSAPAQLHALPHDSARLLIVTGYEGIAPIVLQWSWLMEV